MRSFYLCLSGLVVMTLLSCSKKDRVAATPPEVYVAGSERPVAGGDYNAVLWRSAGPAQKASGGESFGVDVFISGNDIYTCGGIGDKAVYWKNGQVTELTNGNFYATATAIFVKDNIVYVAGYERNSNGFYVAKYWRNGTEVVLSDGSTHAQTSDMIVVGNDIYITGKDAAGALYWKNGTPVVIGSFNINLIKIFVENNDVYVAGGEYTGAGTVIAAYWKNGNEVKLTADNGYGSIMDMFVQNGVVYAAGYEKIGSWNVARYWKNGEGVTISDPSARGSYAFGIALRGKDVYVGFNEDTPDFGAQTRYWHNGQATTLSETGYRTEGSAIALK